MRGTKGGALCPGKLSRVKEGAKEVLDLKHFLVCTHRVQELVNPHAAELGNVLGIEPGVVAMVRMKLSGSEASTNVGDGSVGHS